MKTAVFLSSICLYAFVLVFQSCSEDDEFDGNETKISRYNATESHNTGQNCMNCHHQGGPGEGWFTVAGTVYDSLGTSTYPNATLEFFTGPGRTGDLIYTIEVDGKGNFYTTEQIDFASDLYASMRGTSGSKSMVSSIPIGECNSCHGNTTGRIWVK